MGWLVCCFIWGGGGGGRVVDSVFLFIDLMRFVLFGRVVGRLGCFVGRFQCHKYSI